MKHFSNQEVADILTEMAALHEMQGVEFKPRAYERAALGVQSLGAPLSELYRRGGLKVLKDVPGVGKTIAAHLQELFEHGRFQEYERLKKKIPVKIGELLAVEGIGPRTVKLLWEKLEVKDLKDLERVARGGLVRRLAGFGERFETRVLKGIEFLRQTGGRFLWGQIAPEARFLEETITGFPEVTKAVIAGSFRRRKETVGDIDILVISSDSRRTMTQFVKLPVVSHVYGQGGTKANVRLKNGLDVDVRAVSGESFGAALNYFTGSKDHNVALREIALKKGWKLNEYGLFQGGKRLAGGSEPELYQKLGLSYVEPELRENRGELEAAAAAKLPSLIDYGGLRGDLQVHTVWSDGKNSIEEMAAAAAAIGLQYIAVTDHTRSLAMAGGLDERRLSVQAKEIDRVNERLRARGLKMTVLKSAEVNIGKDGGLDIADAALAKLDLVAAGVHSHFQLPRFEQTRRLVRAIRHPYVHLLVHPSGRLINRRQSIEADWQEVFAAASETGTILEVDASPARLDLNDEQIRQATAAGVKLAIDSDAHSPDQLRYTEFGVAQARRGWAGKKNVVNTLPLRAFRAGLKSVKINTR